MALHRHSNALVDVLPPEADSTISVMSQTERPDVTYQVRVLRKCCLLVLFVWGGARRNGRVHIAPVALQGRGGVPAATVRKQHLPACLLLSGLPALQVIGQGGASPHNWQLHNVAAALSAHLQDIGGMDIQKQEIKEAVELPLVQVGNGCKGGVGGRLAGQLLAPCSNRVEGDAAGR